MLDDQLDRLHTLIGRIATNFSSVEQLWYLIFTGLLPDAPRPAVDAIFNKIRGGRQQRDLLLSVAEATLDAQSDLLRSIRLDVAKTNAAADRRNAAIHSIIHISPFTIPPRIAAMGISRVSRLADKNIAAEIADLHRAIFALEWDVERIRMEMIERSSTDIEPWRSDFESYKTRAQQQFESDHVLRAVEGRL